MVHKNKYPALALMFLAGQTLTAEAASPAGSGTNDFPARREMVVAHAYLHLPVSAKGKDRRMRISVDGKIVRDFAIAFSEDRPDFYAACETEIWKGKKIVLELEHPSNASALDGVVEADEVPGADRLYKEALRPQFHFSPRWGWIGDPNGLVFDKGEYHMFFQYNPYATKWGNMHWGHAVSPDLLHWKEWPIELYPPKFGDNPYSGSAVVDGERITLIFPSTGRGICLAMSANGGKNFSEFEGNPISKGNFGGDPRVFWHEATKRWVMITCKILKTAPEAPPGTPGWLGKATCAFLFYTSTDLKNWEYQSQVEDCWECPDLFALAVDGDPRQTKWVLLANSTPSLVAKGKYAGGRYLIGDFDGKAFKAEGERLQLNFGNAYGAAQSYNGIPAADGRRINVGCAFGSKMPSMPFAQMMNFPTELSLRSTADGLRLCTLPIREIKTLHTNTRIFENVAATPEGTRLPGVEGDLFDISAELSPDAETEELGLMVRGIPITYRIGPAQLVCADRSATLKPEGNWVKLRLLVDRVSIEIFANEGLVYMPMAVLPKDGERGISVFAKGGAPKTVKLTVHSLASAWENVKK